MIIGGRLGYVLFYNFTFFVDNPASIVRVWEGGMSFVASVVIAVYSFVNSMEFFVVRCHLIALATAWAYVWSNCKFYKKNYG